MNRDEILKEINRVKKAMEKTDSPILKRDYKKHLIKLQKQLKKTGVNN